MLREILVLCCACKTNFLGVFKEIIILSLKFSFLRSKKMIQNILNIIRDQNFQQAKEVASDKIISLFLSVYTDNKNVLSRKYVFKE